MKSTFLRTLLPIGLAAALTPVAVAAFPAAALADACTVKVNPASESYGYVTSAGSYSGCAGMTVKIMIERSRWYGWEAVKTVSIPSPGTVTKIGYDCLGTGIHSFRAHVNAHTAGLDYDAYSNTLADVAC